MLSMFKQKLLQQAFYSNNRIEFILTVLPQEYPFLIAINIFDDKHPVANNVGVAFKATKGKVEKSFRVKAVRSIHTKMVRNKIKYTNE